MMGDVVALAPRQQIVLDAAANEIVEHLVRCHLLAAGKSDQFLQVVDVEIADAPMPNLARPNQRVERIEVSFSGTAPRQCSR